MRLLPRGCTQVGCAFGTDRFSCTMMASLTVIMLGVAVASAGVYFRLPLLSPLLPVLLGQLGPALPCPGLPCPALPCLHRRHGMP